jgi:ABC-2 type transport system ATP-binding protein
MIGLIMREGRTVLFSSHILGDVERVSERIVVIDKGVLRAYCSLEKFREAITKVIFTFAETVPDDVNIDGLLHCKRTEKQIELTLVGTNDEQIAEWAKSAGAENYDIVKMNLEDQFIEFTAPANQKKLFKWEVR